MSRNQKYVRALQCALNLWKKNIISLENILSRAGAVIIDEKTFSHLNLIFLLQFVFFFAKSETVSLFSTSARKKNYDVKENILLAANSGFMTHCCARDVFQNRISAFHAIASFSDRLFWPSTMKYNMEKEPARLSFQPPTTRETFSHIRVAQYSALLNHEPILRELLPRRFFSAVVKSKLIPHKIATNGRKMESAKIIQIKQMDLEIGWRCYHRRRNLNSLIHPQHTLTSRATVARQIPGCIAKTAPECASRAPMT